MGIMVLTGKYERNHGSRPYGRGCWAFEIDGKTYWFEKDRAILYSEAKKLAIDKAKELKAVSITVLS